VIGVAAIRSGKDRCHEDLDTSKMGLAAVPLPATAAGRPSLAYRSREFEQQVRRDDPEKLEAWEARSAVNSATWPG